MKIHYEVSGDASLPTLILGASLGADGSMWEPQRDYLNDKFRIVTFELRGHGRSPLSPQTPSIDEFADDVIEIVDDLGVDRFAYCGLSIGAAIGQSLGGRYGHRLSALILTATGMTVMSPEALIQRANSVKEIGMAATADTFAPRWFADSFIVEHPKTVSKHLNHMRSMDPQGFADGCLALSTFDGTALAAANTVPTLVIAGELDLAAPVESCQVLAGAVSGAKFAVIAGASHLCNVERPEEFATLMFEHLQQHAE